MRLVMSPGVSPGTSTTLTEEPSHKKGQSKALTRAIAPVLEHLSASGQPNLAYYQSRLTAPVHTANCRYSHSLEPWPRPPLLDRLVWECFPAALLADVHYSRPDCQHVPYRNACLTYAARKSRRIQVGQYCSSNSLVRV